VPFDVPISEARDGILALIRRNSAALPPTLSSVPLNPFAEVGCTSHQIAAITGHKTIAMVQKYSKAANSDALQLR
jgi:hypothetical protein